MILPIVQYGDPLLRRKCQRIDQVDDSIVALVADMIETMYDADGVGLAAPQIGRAIRLAVIDVSHAPERMSYVRVNGEDRVLEEIMPLVFINPVIEGLSERESDEEGCLSIRDIRAQVRRPVAVKARLPQLDGSVLELETDGLLARALQHEIDHLNGILFVDRISPAAKVGMRRKLRRLAAELG